MTICYDTDLEELAYHKTSNSLVAEADWRISSKSADVAHEWFFKAALKMSSDVRAGRCGAAECHYIALHSDASTLEAGSYLLFFGLEEEIFNRVRNCEDRVSDI